MSNSAPSGAVSNNSGNPHTATAMLKKWDDCNAEEKLEKLRIEAFQHTSDIRNMENIFQQVEKLNQHSHNELGQIVVPIQNLYRDFMGRGEKRSSYLE